MTDPLVTQLDRVIVAIHSADNCAAYPGGKPWLTDDWRRYERMARAAIEAAGAPLSAHCCCGLVGTNYYTTHHCGVCGRELPEGSDG